MPRLKAIEPRITNAGRMLAPPAKLVDPFYLSAAWQTLVRTIKRHRGYVCEACGRDCTATPRGLIGDHVIERKDGGADLDPLNIRLLCAGCHNAKTAGARTRRMGRGA